MGIPNKRRRQPRPGRVDRNISDQLQRDFSAIESNQVWVSDIAELATGEGKLYLCVIKDQYDGATAVWKTSTQPTVDWVTSTVELALAKRPLSHGTVLHNDQNVSKKLSLNVLRTVLTVLGVPQLLNT